MNISDETIIGIIVAKDYRTAAIFEQAGIDFCCNGNRTIASACDTQKISAAELISRLQEIANTPLSIKDTNINYTALSLDLLADHIEKKHHHYVTEQIPLIQAYLERTIRTHGDKHPELEEIKWHFDACAGELSAHMKKEELILFPFIRKMAQAKQHGEKEMRAPFGTVQNPIQMMMHEHDTEGERFRKISALSDQYATPADGCSTYKTAYAALQAFEEDLHLHIHLENNILFPKAIEMEQSFTHS